MNHKTVGNFFTTLSNFGIQMFFCDGGAWRCGPYYKSTFSNYDSAAVMWPVLQL